MQQGYIPVGDHLFLSLATGLLHYCSSGSDIFELLRLTGPFLWQGEDTEKRKVAKEVAV